MKGPSLVRSASTFLAGLVIGAIGIGLVTAQSHPAAAGPTRFTTAQLQAKLEKGEVRNMVWQGTKISGDLPNGSRFTADVPESDSVEAQPLLESLRTSRSGWRMEGPPPSTALAQTATLLAFPVITFTIALLFLAMAIVAVIRLVGRGGTPPRLQH